MVPVRRLVDIVVEILKDFSPQKTLFTSENMGSYHATNPSSCGMSQSTGGN